MDELHSDDVEIVIKSVGNEGIIIRDTKQFTEKGEEIKTTEYFLEVEDHDMTTIEESTEAQYIQVQSDCDEDQTAQFVAVDIEDNGDIILHDKDIIVLDELCRICASESDRLIPIFSGEGLEHELCHKIHTHLPLKISENDTLPLQVCYNCAATLVAWHEMFKGCLDAQQRLSDIQEKCNLKAEEQYYNNTVMEDENMENVLEMKEINKEEPQVETKIEDNADQVQIVNLTDSDRDSSPNDNVQECTLQTYTYMCGICDELYTEESKLLLHLKKDHKETMSRTPIRYECHLCGKSYLQKGNLIKHMDSHTTELPGEAGMVEKAKIFVNQVLLFKCDICQHVLSHRRAFLRHLRVHRDERPIICHVCGKRFRIEDDLKRHVDDVHEKIKRFACDICGTSFAAKSTRDAHRRIHTGEKPFPCPICKKQFRSINLLGIHKRTHTDYRPHQCSYCEKAFRDRQKLTAHEAIHTGNRPYPCDVCGKMFAAKAEATRHRSVHFGHKPFLCSECGMSFRLNRYLRTHIKVHHKENAEALLGAMDNN